MLTPKRAKSKRGMGATQVRGPTMQVEKGMDGGVAEEWATWKVSQRRKQS